MYLERHTEKMCNEYIYIMFSYFHSWMVTAYRHSLQGGEALRSHPQQEYSKLDKRRLRISSLERL